MENPAPFAERIFPLKKSHTLLYLFAVLQSLLFSMVLSANLLGFFKLYRPLPVIPLTILVFFLSLYLYFKFLPPGFWERPPTEPPGDKLLARFDLFLLVISSLVILLLVVFPLAAWPQSYITPSLPHDAALYHFPKAVNLYQAGSAWEHSAIAYWHYPFGYEGLLSFGLTLTGDEALFGAAHALIALYFLTAVWLLARRYTSLPMGTLLFAITFILVNRFPYALIDFIEAIPLGNYSLGTLYKLNPWWGFEPLLHTIGKNDLLVAAATLAMVLHSPIENQTRKPALHLIGLAVATTLAISVKPNGALAAAPLWALAGYQIFKSQPRPLSKELKTSLALSALILAGGLPWVIRNLTLLGGLFPQTALNLTELSAVNFLPEIFSNPFSPRTSNLVIVLLAVILVSWRVKQRPSGGFLAALFFLLAAFLVTPASAIPEAQSDYVAVQWRLGAALLAYTFTGLLLVAEPALHRFLCWLTRTKASTAISLAALVLFAALVVVKNDQYLKTNPANRIVVQDAYRQPIGSDGYRSAYEYIQENIQGASIRIDNGLPYYAYGPGYTNYPSVAPYELVPQGDQPLRIDTYLVFKSEDQGPDGYPAALAQPDFLALWELVYEDQVSRVYQVK